MSEFIVGQLVRVKAEIPRYGADYPQGTEGVIKSVELERSTPYVEVKSADSSYSQVFHPDDIELIQTTLPVKASREAIQKEDTVTTAIPKTDIKTLYTVVKNGETHYYGYDREKARQEKADLGGLASGAEIIQFKPVKTVR